jgi:hypothetical protein
LDEKIRKNIENLTNSLTPQVRFQPMNSRGEVAVNFS